MGSETPSTSGSFTPSFEITCNAANTGNSTNSIRYRSQDMIAIATYKRSAQPLHFNVRCAVCNEACITFYHNNGVTKRRKMFEFWIHTSYLPEDGRLILTKQE